MPSQVDVPMRMDELKRQIDHHRFCYYILDRPEISDAEFDKLFNELVRLESENPELVTLDSPTQKVGSAPSTDFKQVRHKIPMLSLSNAMGAEELGEWNERLVKSLGKSTGGHD